MMSDISVHSHASPQTDPDTILLSHMIPPWISSLAQTGLRVVLKLTSAASVLFISEQHGDRNIRSEQSLNKTLLRGLFTL